MANTAAQNRARAARCRAAGVTGEGSPKHDKQRGQTIVLPIRYADDFLLLVGAPPGPEQYERARQDAEKEKAAVAALLKQQLGLELSETKTLVTPATKAFAFLGHHIVVRYNRAYQRKACVTLIPKEKKHRLRERIKRPGIINPENDIVYLPLKKGTNEVVLAVSELGGGWGFICRLADVEN